MMSSVEAEPFFIMLISTAVTVETDDVRLRRAGRRSESGSPAR
jgi:hypothetical protein